MGVQVPQGVQKILLISVIFGRLNQVPLSGQDRLWYGSRLGCSDQTPNPTMVTELRNCKKASFFLLDNLHTDGADGQ